MNQLSPENRSYINQIKRLPCQPSQSSASIYQSSGLTERQGDQAIKQFRREIQQRFKLSVSNKIYTFPRKFTNISDFVSSDQENEEEQESIETKMNFEKKNFKKKSYINQVKKSSKSKEYMNTNTSLKIQKSKSKKKTDKVVVKQSNRSKRLRTQPDSVNYVQTIRLKMKKH